MQFLNENEKMMMDVAQLEQEARQMRAKFIATAINQGWARLVAVAARRPMTNTALNN